VFAGHYPASNPNVTGSGLHSATRFDDAASASPSLALVVPEGAGAVTEHPPGRVAVLQADRNVKDRLGGERGPWVLRQPAAWSCRIFIPYMGLAEPGLG
jgi:hypothetical protein